jgi:hypothetical protein
VADWKKGDYKVRAPHLIVATEATVWDGMFQTMGRKQLMWYIRSTLKAGLHPGMTSDMVKALIRAIPQHEDSRPIWADWRRSLKRIASDLKYIGQ